MKIFLKYACLFTFIIPFLNTSNLFSQIFSSPVLLSSFTYQVNRNEVTLTWITSQEEDNSGFEIEMAKVYSNEQSEWENIGFVTGNGTTSSFKTYNFIYRAHTGNYKFRLKQFSFNGNFEYFYLESFYFENTVYVGVPTPYKLTQNYPNPFNPTTKIDYNLPFDGKVSLKIFDMTGREISTLVDEFKTPGYYTAEFNGKDLSSGIYFYTLTFVSNDDKQIFKDTKIMILVK